MAYASRIFANSVAEGLLGGLCLLPGISALIRLMKVNTFKPKETRFFRDVVLQSIRQRQQQSGERKNDLIDLMIDSMKEEGEEERLKIDEELVVATAMVMLIAGCESDFAKMFDILFTKCFGGSRNFCCEILAKVEKPNFLITMFMDNCLEISLRTSTNLFDTDSFFAENCKYSQKLFIAKRNYRFFYL